jgi:serine/threonine-protein kinase
MALPSGARLGSYEIVGLLGAGGMDEAYRATDTRLDHQVAIKVLPEAVRADPERVARFEREANSSPETSLAISGLERDNGDQFIASPIPIAEALQIAKQIAEAPEATHGQVSRGGK